MKTFWGLIVVSVILLGICAVTAYWGATREPSYSYLITAACFGYAACLFAFEAIQEYAHIKYRRHK